MLFFNFINILRSLVLSGGSIKSFIYLSLILFDDKKRVILYERMVLISSDEADFGILAYLGKHFLFSFKRYTIS